MAETGKVYVNGINAVTGEYLVKPKTPKQLARYITGEPDRNILTWLTRIWQLISTPHLGLAEDPTDIRQVGWGIIFHAKEKQAVKNALSKLIDQRRKQVGDEKKVKILEYRDDESFKDFLGRYGLAPGGKDFTKVPYYLLLVGSPEQIPFLFSNLLDIEYAVGRLHFDAAAGYQAYVETLLAYEQDAHVPNAREAVFFGTRHPFDKATQLSADKLVTPLANGIPSQNGMLPKPGIAGEMGYGQKLCLAQTATKAALAEVLAPPTGQKQPAFLFSATHGMGFPSGHADQVKAQGALLCQDWPGFGQISPKHYFAAADVPPEAHVHGLVAFHFACYGAGTPKSDRFLHEPGVKPPVIAPQAFIASLPKALLTHPNGGALAVIGHVERAWGYSIETPEAGPTIETFRNTIGRILFGLPVGYAVKDFNERYASISTILSALLETRSFGGNVPDTELAANWIERNDAEGYVVLGDPAVRLRVNDLLQ